MATKKALGSAKKNRDSIAKRLGIKVYGNQAVQPGSIIVRQRGVAYRPGVNVRIGKDYTIYSTVKGTVQFTDKTIKNFTGATKEIKVVNVTV
ncbi:MAG: 50S ribosomal protein L27 [Patescibacteria group bacterium]